MGFVVGVGEASETTTARTVEWQILDGDESIGKNMERHKR
jgi:hypothetical protein